MPPRMTWQSDDRCVVGETVFQTLPVDLFEREEPRMSMEGADFFLFKERPLLETYADLVERIRPERIFELGIFEGGSTAFLYELARPRRLVAIDIKPPTRPDLGEYVSQRGLESAVRVHANVDQSDRRQLAQIVSEEFGNEPLDLVIDDCSHMYEPTRESFNELFPRLRPGGVYVIEDWRWAHARLGHEPSAGMWPDKVPLTRLVFELIIALPSVPGVVEEITIELPAVWVRRGDAELDPDGFDISACSEPRGRSLLASTN